MPEAIKVEIEDDRLQRTLRKVYRKVKDLSPAMREIAGIMADAVEENFEAEGRPAWPELAEATIAQRTKQGNWPGKILQRSGGLVDSITAESDETSAVVGTNKRYAAIHQLGGMAGRGNKVEIPARDFLSMGDDDIEEAVEVVERYLEPH